MTEQAQRDVLAAAFDVCHRLLDKHRGLGPWKEDSSLRPAMVEALERRGFRCHIDQRLRTTVRRHPFDILWERGGILGAIELKLKGRGAPADDTRLFFWYDLKWLESGIAAGSFAAGTALLVTDLAQLREESGRGDWRHDYYRIGWLHAHRCSPTGPDHVFDRKYKPETQFLPELFPLRIQGCYDFRDKWHLVSDGSEASLFLLAVPVAAQPAAAPDLPSAGR